MQSRYTIEAIIKTADVEQVATLTLADRMDMLYPVLLGRDFLRNNFVVDISRQFFDEKVKKEGQ
jgi:hypothetical protein